MDPLRRTVTTTYMALITPGTTIPVWIGHPGGAKTSCQRWLAQALGIETTLQSLTPGEDGAPATDNNLVWIAAQHSPEDFGGWATPRANGLHFEAPFRVAQLCKAKRAMFFLDEMGNTPRATQAAMLRFICERSIGDIMLPPSVLMMGAMNQPESGADVQEISKPLANRVVWIKFPAISVDEHVAYMAAFDTPGKLEFPKFDLETWREHYVKAVQVYYAFMRLPQHAALLNEDPNSEAVMGRNPLAYGTPRSWSAVVRYTATCMMMNDFEALLELATGTVGEAAGMEFVACAQRSDLVDPEAALKDPTLVRHDPSRPDKLFAELLGVAMAGSRTDLKPKETMDRWHAAWSCIEHAMATGAPKDTCLIAAQYLGTHLPKGNILEKHAETILMLTPMVAASGYELPV